MHLYLLRTGTPHRQSPGAKLAAAVQQRLDAVADGVGRLRGTTPACRLDGFRDGAAAADAALRQAIDMASTVTAVYRNGSHTVLRFADGTKTRVTYDPSNGRPYDDATAIMAAMLKRLVGNKYIEALDRFARPCSCYDDVCAAAAVCDPVADEDEPAHGCQTTDPVARALQEIQAADGDAYDAELWADFQAMPDEPDMDPYRFASTDPVTRALQGASMASVDGDAPEIDPQPVPDEPETDPCRIASTDPVAVALYGTEGALAGTDADT